ncbi:hypothetical protein BAnh1_06560 [Bartonella australis AUST/NH1]|uniref:Ricin B lectin domain-containing protein n=1 Tax=Bartonella australis (strain Aust/NH1) TaxID=1094489 RepID=M1P3Z0_BARAA|nr:DUF1561 family protein [Bartonella australis]AGF74535.1 hypothetical protein BAnh1_06560 [Bartonella australis AUST/NH1]
MSFKFFLSFFIVLSSFNSLAAFSNPPSPAVIQKPADDPVDKSIRVNISGGGEYCYAPVFTKGEGYVYLDDCSSSYVRSGRYDVFQRIAWEVNKIWLCMTAPGSVTGIDGDGKANWDYITLRPCALNDANQRWVINGRAIYTADARFRVKHTGWYAYISKNKRDPYDHALNQSMDGWVKTVAKPGTLSLKTPVSWKYATSTGFVMYYLTDRGFVTEGNDLYYNPENGHVGYYYVFNGLLSCMYSPQSAAGSYGWVTWQYCDDTIPKARDNFSWDIAMLLGNEGSLFNSYGSVLRVYQSGPDWGYPYAANLSFLKRDTSNNPTSDFVFSYDIERWSRYISGDAMEELPYCPAPGTKPTIFKSKRMKRSLPRDFRFLDFEFNETWKRRFYDTATSTAGTETLIGICGTCLLHTYQIIAEVMDSYPGDPRSRGYFFDLGSGVDPIVAVERRFPRLHSALRHANVISGVPLNPRRRGPASNARSAAAATQVALPNYNWQLSPIATNPVDIRNAVGDLLNAPVGTVWVGLTHYTRASGQRVAHAVPIFRSRGGIIVVPTNIRARSMSYEEYSRHLTELREVEAIMSQLAQLRTEPIIFHAFATVRLTGAVSRPLSVTISQYNCTGEGENRRGSRHSAPSSSLINQCSRAGGRCSIM